MIQREQEGILAGVHQKDFGHMAFSLQKSDYRYLVHLATI